MIVDRKFRFSPIRIINCIQEEARDSLRIKKVALLAQFLVGLDVPLLDYEAVQRTAEEVAESRVQTSRSTVEPSSTAVAALCRYVSVAPKLLSERASDRLTPPSTPSKDQVSLHTVR